MPKSSRSTGLTSSVLVAALLSAPLLAHPLLLRPAAVSAQTVIGATAIGIGDELSFRDRTDEVPVPVPVPAGLTPRTLSGTIQTPVGLERGHLEAWSGDLLLARIPVDGAEEFVRVEVPLDRARVRDEVADVTLRTVLNSGSQACPDWSERSLKLRDSEVRYDGEPEAPRVLSDFIPPVLDRLEIYLADEPTPVEAEAAAELATTVSARFGRRGVEVEVLPVSAPRADSASPFTRRVEIREGGETRLDLIDAPVPTVVISGDASTLAQQSRSVSTDLGQLAVTDAVTVNAQLPVPRALMTEATLDELGTGSITARSSGTVRAGFGLDQTRLATVTGEVTVDLRGSYSPPPAGRSGLMVVTAGGTVLDSWVADQSGVLDRTVTVPADLLGRYTEVDVSLQTAGEGAACGVAQPLTMIVSGDTRVRITEPASPAPRGFESLPQALMPRVQVATGTRSLADVGRAVTILAELQRLSELPIRSEWVSVDDLLASGAPGILVASDGVPGGLPLPLELTGGRTMEVLARGQDEPSTMRFYEDIDFASLQVVEDDDRAIVVASTTSGSAELDRTLDWLGSDPDRWNGLRGNVLFTAPDREPAALSTTEALLTATTEAESPRDVRTALVVGAVITVAGLVLAGILWVAMRRGRSGRRS